MAKKRKGGKKSAVRSRRRIGAAAKGNLTNVLYTLGGAVLGRVLVTKLPDNVGGVDIQKFKPAIPLAVGYFLPSFMKSSITAPLANGMMVAGGLELLNQFGVIGAMGLDAPFVAGIEYGDNSNVMAPMVGSTYCG